MHQLRRDYVDDFHAHRANASSEQTINSSSGQMLCFNCEELVSRSATMCPYCRVSLTVDAAAQSPSSLLKKASSRAIESGRTKITPLSHTANTSHSATSYLAHAVSHNETSNYEPSHMKLQSQKNHAAFLDSHQREEKDQTASHSSSPAVYISSLLSFLIGGAFFFFGIAIPLLAKDGVFTLSWDESLWIPFLGCGLALIAVGYLFLNRIDRDFDLD